MCCVEDELVGQLGRGGLRPDWANGFRIRFGFQKNHRARKDVETYESYFSRHHHSYRREKELARSPRCSTGTNACVSGCRVARRATLTLFPLWEYMISKWLFLLPDGPYHIKSNMMG